MLAAMLAVMATSGCNTILEYPEGPGVDPTRPDGRLLLNLELDMEMGTLGEYEYDFADPSNPKTARVETTDVVDIMDYLNSVLSVDSHLRRFVINAYAPGDNSSCPAVLWSRTLTCDINADGAHTVELDVAPGDYRVVVWCDYLPRADANGHYYDASEFNEIILRDDNGHPGGNSYRDAFYGETAVKVGTSTEGAVIATALLKRPMARYTFVSTDLREFLDKAAAANRPNAEGGRSDAEALGDYTARLVYTRYMPCSFNVHTGRPADSRTGVEYRTPVSALDNDKAQLAFDYVFTNGSDTSVSVAMEVLHSDGTVVARMPQFDVPLRRSHHTVVTGKFLTTKSGGDIGVNPEFDGGFNIEIK